jgi:hypothetical protein
MAVDSNELNGQVKCPRCNRSYTRDTICKFCKQDLMQIYDYEITWQVAYEIEKEVKLSKRLRLRL